MKTIENRISFPLVTALVAVSFCSTVQAQFSRPPTFPLNLEGQWHPQGPWDLLDSMTDPNCFPIPPAPGVLGCIGEIAHGAVLPAPASNPNMIRVLLMNAAYNGFTRQDGLGPKAFVWSPRFPGTATTLTLPGPPSCAMDPLLTGAFFCSGHSFDAQGDLIIAGGTDLPMGPPFYGTDATYRLDTSVHPPAFSCLPDMQRDRWYPVVITLGDGSLMTAGHALNPVVSPPSEETNEILDPAKTAWTLSENKTEGVDCPTPGPLADLHDYPRLHLLSSGNVLHTNTLINGSAATYLWDPTLCPPEGRWKVASSPLNIHSHGSSVHYIVRPNNGVRGTPSPITEVIYQLGGGQADGAEDSCYAGTSFAAMPARFVEKIVDPDLTSPWLTAPSMVHERMNQNTVILADGSMLAVGGFDEVGSNCVGVTTPERYEPPEVFGDPMAVWEEMAVQDEERRYHSVAGLLPDGRVYSAGGNIIEPTPSASYTIELYSPHYLFTGTRPTITSSPPAAALGGTFEIQVQLGSTVIDRVVLIRNNSTTHAFDSNQRYVELEHEELEGSTVVVRAPENHDIAPLGKYMLIVQGAQGANRIPSKAKWIQLVP